MPSIDFTGFDGIRNTVPDYRIGESDLSAATNVDIDDSKRVVRRGGFTQISASSAHSLFSNGEFCLYVRGTDLMVLRRDFTAGVLLPGVSGERMACCGINGIAYLTDGTRAWVTDGEGIAQWGITPPNRQPGARSGDGLLPRGDYQYAVTFLRQDGEESGTGLSGAINAIGGIEFYDIPVSADPAVSRKAIYLTTPGGKTLRRAMTIKNADTVAIYSGDALNLGVTLNTQFKQHAPAGNHVATFNGRALVALQDFLLYSDAYRFQLFDPVRQSFQFDSRIRMVAPVLDGVFIGTETSLWYLAGDDITQAQLTKTAPYGAIPNTLAMVDGSMVLDGLTGVVGIFASENGICAIGNGGFFKNLSLDRYVYQAAANGAATTRMRPGMNQYITALR